MSQARLVECAAREAVGMARRDEQQVAHGIGSLLGHYAHGGARRHAEAEGALGDRGLRLDQSVPDGDERQLD